MTSQSMRWNVRTFLFSNPSYLDTIVNMLVLEIESLISIIVRMVIFILHIIITRHHTNLWWIKNDSLIHIFSNFFHNCAAWLIEMKYLSIEKNKSYDLSSVQHERYHYIDILFYCEFLSSTFKIEHTPLNDICSMN